LAALSHACSVAVNEWEWLEDNPMRKIKKLTEPRGRVRFLSDEERNSLLKACKCAPYKGMYLIVVMALSTGARRSEIQKLKWRDIDFERKQIVLHETKNKERRVIPLQGHAYELLKQWANIIPRSKCAYV